MNKIKMVITDLDGTFLNNEEIVSQRNIQAIKKLKESGILFGFATGRPICSVENLIPKWQMDGMVDFIIGLNGGHIKDYKKKKDIFKLMVILLKILSNIFMICLLILEFMMKTI